MDLVEGFLAVHERNQAVIRMADDGELSGSGDAGKGGCGRIGIGKLIAFDIVLVGCRPSPFRESGGRINRKRGISGRESGIIHQSRSVHPSIQIKLGGHG